MAIGASIYKLNVNLSNLNSHYYEDFNLTIARHPSENEARMMFRIMTFLYCAHVDLEFTKGLCATEEPELWQKGYSGEIIQWIELGLPDIKRIRQACGKAQSVKIFTYHENKALDWYEKIKGKLEKNKKVKVFHLKVFNNGPVENLANKSMKLDCLIEDHHMYLSNESLRVGIEIQEA